MPISSRLRAFIDKVDPEAAGSEVKKVASSVRSSLQNARQHARDRELEHYKRGKEETEAREKRVYGRVLTASERTDFMRYQREKAKRRQARYGAVFGQHSDVSTSSIRKSEIREFKRLLAEARQRRYRSSGNGSGGFGGVGSGGVDLLVGRGGGGGGISYLVGSNNGATKKKSRKSHGGLFDIGLNL